VEELLEENQQSVRQHRRENRIGRGHRELIEDGVDGVVALQRHREDGDEIPDKNKNNRAENLGSVLDVADRVDCEGTGDDGEESDRIIVSPNSGDDERHGHRAIKSDA